MRKRRSGTKNDVIIDLTSLLDVIFIILLVVLCGQYGVRDRLTLAQSETEQMREKAEKEYLLYADWVETEDNLHKYVWAVSVMVPYNKNEVTQREIKLLKEGEEIESFELIGNEVAGSVEAFRNSLIEFIKANQDKPVILSLNEADDYILYRDEVMVNEIFAELSREYSNVYIKGNVGEETK